MASSPSNVIQDDDFTKGLGVGGVMGSSSLGGAISSQTGMGDGLSINTGGGPGGGPGGGGLSGFNSSMNIMSNFEAHRSSSEGHPAGNSLQIPSFYEGLASPGLNEDQHEQNIQQKQEELKN